jgi:hypothetical protein
VIGYSAIGQFLPGLLVAGSTIALDAIVNKYKNMKFDNSLSEKLENTDTVLFSSYSDISCTLEEEKKPAFISFMYSQNTWVCLAGNFRINGKSIQGRIAYREPGANMKETYKKLTGVKDLNLIRSDRKVLIDDYLDGFLVNGCERERMPL